MKQARLAIIIAVSIAVLVIAGASLGLGSFFRAHMLLPIVIFFIIGLVLAVPEQFPVLVGLAMLLLAGWAENGQKQTTAGLMVGEAFYFLAIGLVWALLRYAWRSLRLRGNGPPGIIVSSPWEGNDHNSGPDPPPKDRPTRKGEADRSGKQPGILCILSNPGSWGGANIIAGAEVRTIEILKRWQTLGVGIRTIETVPSASRTLGMSYPVSAFRLPFKGYQSIRLAANTLFMFASCIRLSRSKRDDIGCLVASTSNLLDVAPAWMLSRMWGKPFAVVFQISIYGSSLRETYDQIRQEGESISHSCWRAATARIALHLAKRSSVVFCLSDCIAQDLIRLGLPEGKIHVTGMGLDLTVIENLPEAAKVYDVVFLGRVEKSKGVDDIISAWQTVVSVRPSSRLLILGSGTFLAEAKRRVLASGISGSVAFAGFVAAPEKFVYLKKSRVFAYPSKVKEGWGLAISEALACGLPVVCSENRVFREAFGSCAAVDFVANGDPDVLAGALLRLIGDEAELRRRSELAASFAGHKDWSQVASEELEIIDRTLGIN